MGRKDKRKLFPFILYVSFPNDKTGKISYEEKEKWIFEGQASRYLKLGILQKAIRLKKINGEWGKPENPKNWINVTRKINQEIVPYK